MNKLTQLRVFLLTILAAAGLNAYGQVPEAYTSADIFLKIKKLNVLGSVLYVAAHPDDENNGFLPYLAKERMYRTGYLSLTRGDGGQNLIGSEQGVELGLIRTEELLAARRIDGAEQYFSSAYEFGFSKNAAEALHIWNKDKVLYDIVFVIRKFRPDIIITRFPGDARAGHGHHWASALLANEAFTAAADRTRFPEQFKFGVGPWQAKRILWNGFNFGGAMNTTGQIRLDVGGFDPLLGKSSGDIGGEARSMHKSQGEGRPRRKGEIIENFITTGGDTARTDIMEGVITDWSREKGGDAVAQKITEILQHFNFEHPENSVGSLTDLYNFILKSVPADLWRAKKLAELEDIIFNCSGLFMEAVTREESVLPGDSATITLNVNKRNNTDAELVVAGTEPALAKTISQPLATNQNYSYDLRVLAGEPDPRRRTQPYWLQEPQTIGNFTIPDSSLIGKAWNDALFNVTAEIRINGISFRRSLPVQYKYVDPVKGEVYQPFYLAPHLSVSMLPHVALMNVKTDKGRLTRDSVYVSVKSNFNGSQVPSSLYMLQDVMRTVFDKQPRDFEKGKTYTFPVPVNKYYDASKGVYLETALRIRPAMREYVYSQYFKTIDYDHIPAIHYFFNDHVRFINEEIITTGHKIGYINGAGDRIPEALKDMGFEVTQLTEKDITAAGLQPFDAIVIGIRAHNIYEYLSDKNDVFNEYVRNGGNLIAQYIKSNVAGTMPIKMGPYPFTISTGLRVTDETAPVTFAMPQHPVLNYPNKITSADFDNWIQERSTYQVDRADSHYEMPLTMADPGEKPMNGSLAIARYGKGNFAYVSLVLFRQLPAGNPGAYKLLANLIGLPKNK